MFRVPVGPGSGGLPAYYVDGAAGNDTTGTGAIGAPWKTISKALATIPDIACNIRVAAGTYAENTGGLKYLRILRLFTNWITIRPWNSGDSVVITDAASGTFCVNYATNTGRVRFQDITIEQAGANNQGTISLANGTFAEFVNCTITTVNWCLYSVATGAVSLALSGCTLRQKTGATGYALGGFLYPGDGGAITLSMINCTMEAVSAVGGTIGLLLWRSHANGIINATISGGTYTINSDYAIQCRATTLNISNAVVTSTAGVALVYGTDATGTDGGTGSITGCTVTSSSSHALLIGDECDGVAIVGTTVNGGDHGLVLKECRNISVTNSVLNGGTQQGLYLKAATNCSVDDCAINASTTYAIRAGINTTTGNKAGDNTITDNTVTVTGDADIYLFEAAAGESGGSVVDRNVYDISGTTGDIGSVYGTANITTLAALQDAWNTYDVPTNDVNSTVT